MTKEVLRYIIEAQDKASAVFKQVGTSAGSMGKGMGKIAGQAKALAVPLLAAGTAAGAMGLKMVQSAAKMEQTKIAFKTLLGSADEAAAAIENIKKEAIATPFEQADLMQYNIQLISAGESAEKSMSVIKDLGDAVSAVGGGGAEMSRLIGNMQQIKSVGKATAMDIKQFGNAGIDIYTMLAETTGKSVDQVKDMDVTYDLLTKTFQEAAAEGGRFHGSMDNQSATLIGRWSTLKDSVDILMTSLGERLLPVVGQVLEGAIAIVAEFQKMVSGEGSDMFNNLFEQLRPLADFLSAVFKPIWDELVISFEQMQPHLEKLGEVLLPVVMDILKAVGAVLIFVAGLIVGFIGGLASAMDNIVLFITGLVEIFSGFFNIIVGIFTLNGERIAEGFSQLWQGIQDVLVGAFTAIVEFVAGFIVSIINFFKKLYDVLVGHSIVPDMVKAILKWFTDLFNKAVDIFTNIKNRIIEFVTNIKNRTVELISSMVDTVKSLGSRLYENLISPFTRAWDKIKEIADKIRSTVADAFNMDKRNSPSINDRLGMLQEGIQSTLNSIQVPSYSGQIAGALATTNNNQQQHITFNNEVSSDVDVERLNMQLGNILENKGRY